MIKKIELNFNEKWGTYDDGTDPDGPWWTWYCDNIDTLIEDAVFVVKVTGDKQ